MENKKSECLIIFTRYPEPGKTKTRMIPILGAEGAASLQREMTEFTVKQGQKVQQTRRLSLEVHFAGGNWKSMENWLGSDLVYKQQSGGDLGERMNSAFTLSFGEDMTRVVIIGIDCPEVNSSLLAQAFDSLGEYDLVVGPAKDGGYYLIGLKCSVPELFRGVTWGTGAVLAQTTQIAEKLGLSSYYLDLLEDVDRPEDLPIWTRAKAQRRKG